MDIQDMKLPDGIDPDEYKIVESIDPVEDRDKIAYVERLNHPAGHQGPYWAPFNVETGEWLDPYYDSRGLES